MLAILPVFDRVRNLAWARAAIQGIAPGVIGVMSVALARMAPPAVPDVLAVLVLLVTVAALVLWQVAPINALLGGAITGALRSRVCELPEVRAALCGLVWGR
jgi:chromate transport protein ChrA